MKIAAASLIVIMCLCILCQGADGFRSFPTASLSRTTLPSGSTMIIIPRHSDLHSCVRPNRQSAFGNRVLLELRARRVTVDNPAPTSSDDEGKSSDSTGAIPPKPKKGTGGRKKKAELDSSSVSISSPPPAGASEQPVSSVDDVSSDDTVGNVSIGVADKMDITIADPVGIVDVSTVAASALSPKGKASKSDGGAKKTSTKKSKSKKEVPPTTAEDRSLAMESMGSVVDGPEQEKSSAGGLGLPSLLQLGGADFDFSADSINGLLPNLDENLAELEANLGVLSDEFRFEGGPLSAISGLDGLSDLDIDLMDRLRFDDKDSSMMEGIEGLTESQLQDALMKMDDNDDFNIDSLMRISSSSSDSTKPPELGLKGGKVGRGKNKVAKRQEDPKAKAASSVVKDEDGAAEEDSEEEGGTSMGYAAEGDEEDDLMLDVIVPNENSFELLSDEDDDDDDDDEDDDTLRAATVTTSVLREDKLAGGSADLIVDLQSDELESAQSGQESQSSSEPSSKNILRKTGKMKSAKASGVENLSGEVLELGIVDPPPLEEFRRLMESLGPDSMFEDDTLFGEDDSSIFAGTGSDDSEYYTYGGAKKTPKKIRSLDGDAKLSDTSADEEGEEEEEDFDMDIDDFGVDDKVRFSTATAKRATGIGRVYKSITDDNEGGIVESSENEKVWLPRVYEGGDPYLNNSLKERDPDLKAYLDAHDDPSPWRAQIVAVVTNSSSNGTALEYVHKVFDFIKAGTNNDDRIVYQILSFSQIDDQPFEELDGMIQMWLESYNTYHLIDGLAMREAWGAIMPHIILSEKNLKAILEQVKWALAEDGMEGALLTPRLRTLRFRGGAQEMSTGYNTETLDSEFSVVSVR